MNKETFCSLPFSGLFLGSDGGLRPCCSLRGDLGNINNNTVEEILQGDISTSIRKSIINNEWHPMCSQCKELESRGARTERTGTTYRIDDFKNADEKFFRLEKLDLRWSNTCNLTCNYCYEYFSSKWAEIKGIRINANKDDAEFKVFSFIEDHKQHLNNINLLGGEPLLQKPNIRLLDTIPNSVPIYILTNLTQPLEKNAVAQKLLENPNVSWGISFETIGKRFEYVRHGGSWYQLLDNLHYLSYKKVINIDTHPLYCLYSAFNIMEYYDFIESEGYFNHLYWQVLQNIEGLDVFRSAYPLKVKAVNELEKVFVKYENKYDMTLLKKIYESLLSTLTTQFFTSNDAINFLNTLDKQIPNKKQEFIINYTDLYIELLGTQYFVLNSETEGIVCNIDNTPVYSSAEIII
jgi:MoaA/NifB/PqqE/SkfB family radical SAM enzyme